MSHYSRIGQDVHATDTFYEYLKLNFIVDIRGKIQKHTKRQGASFIWKQQHIGALTSSTIHMAAHYSRSEKDNYVVQQIMRRTSFQGNAATYYGKQQERLVRKLYFKEMKEKRKRLKVTETGLFIDEDNPICASPDGLVSCKYCGTGLIEIKCPYSDKNSTAEE